MTNLDGWTELGYTEDDGTLEEPDVGSGPLSFFGITVEVDGHVLAPDEILYVWPGGWMIHRNVAQPPTTQ